jgi:hydrocephalus-inducing protein
MLLVTYKDHPQREAIELVGELFYPNLRFSSQRADFGCILNNMEKRIIITARNEGAIPVRYRWSFLGTFQDINQVFDILPISGSVEPGQAEKIEFMFYARVDKGFATTAICSVEGGPQYEIALNGESSSIQYRLEKRIIEFGLMPYQGTAVKEYFVYNTGKVNFTYSINTDKCSNWIRVSPSTGTIVSNGSQKFNVYFTPRVPEKIEGQFFVQVEHCDAESILFFGDAVSHHTVFSLPRVPDELFAQFLAHAKKVGRRSEEQNFDRFTVGKSEAGMSQFQSNILLSDYNRLYSKGISL